MASYDVESLFTITPLDETIEICYNSLSKNQDLLSNINKIQFETLLRATVCNTFYWWGSYGPKFC